MWTKVTQQSQGIKTELALPSPGRKETKAGLGVEGSAVVGALAELGGQASPRCSETIPSAGGRADGRQAAPVSLIIVISWQ